MDDNLRYNDFQMFLGISAGIAVGAIAGTLITASIIHQEQKNKRLIRPEEWQRYFSFLNRASRLVIKDIPEMFHEINKDKPRTQPRLAPQDEVL